LINIPTTRADIHAVDVPASDEAVALGNPKLMNVVMIGALIACTEVVSLEALEGALASHLPERHRALLDLNKTALRRGMELARQQMIV
jgi:2-oxoglutarate ferredoxin oxidoreductase subunit gamma